MRTLNAMLGTWSSYLDRISLAAAIHSADKN
jgi:hypothetical protein